MELNPLRSWRDGAAMVERVAAVERIRTIMREPGNASVEVQSPGIAQVNAALGTGAHHGPCAAAP
ncbi:MULTISPECIES: hypothetical protein [Burkholderia cepacia complex]|uniref:hypothetical protein n=1 Tax=Burkholderia cepacia complex TaxID=87882 RepID=UPI0013DE0195|nr:MULTISPECIES: hypothetical protein [Burkholderia cepacia complex]